MGKKWNDAMTLDQEYSCRGLKPPKLTLSIRTVEMEAKVR